jgi:hypothetical protein
MDNKYQSQLRPTVDVRQPPMRGMEPRRRPGGAKECGFLVGLKPKSLDIARPASALRQLYRILPLDDLWYTRYRTIVFTPDRPALATGLLSLEDTMKGKRQMNKRERQEWRTQVEKELRGSDTFCMIPKRAREPKGAVGVVRPLRR